jgi:hypothetical protein
MIGLTVKKNSKFLVFYFVLFSRTVSKCGLAGLLKMDQNVDLGPKQDEL